jgi:hypothetical protein
MSEIPQDEQERMNKLREMHQRDAEDFSNFRLDEAVTREKMRGPSDQPLTSVEQREPQIENLDNQPLITSVKELEESVNRGTEVIAEKENEAKEVLEEKKDMHPNDLTNTLSEIIE